MWFINHFYKMDLQVKNKFVTFLIIFPTECHSLTTDFGYPKSIDFGSTFVKSFPLDPLCAEVTDGCLLERRRVYDA